MLSLSRRTLLAGGAAGAGLGAWRAHRRPREPAAGLIHPAPREGVLNDASLLSETRVARHLTLSHDAGDLMLADLRDAAAEGRPVTAGAARHSMGGHAIPRGGLALSLPRRGGHRGGPLGGHLFRAQAGTRWREAIARPDHEGLSPKVMRSNHDFGIGATFAVNAQGWPCAHPPMGAGVRRARPLPADGTDLWTPRTEDADLFRAAMGG